MARIRADAYTWLEYWLFESPDRAEGDHQLIMELVDSIRDDTWRRRWYSEYDAAQDVHDLQPREGWHILMYEEPDELDTCAVGIVTMVFDPDGSDSAGSDPF